MELEESIINSIINMASGSFLWVNLITKAISELITWREMHQAIKKVSEEMNKLYQRIIDSVFKDTNHQSKIMRLMQ